MDKPRWDSWTTAVQEDARTGRVAMKIGSWCETEKERVIPAIWTREEAMQKIAEYIREHERVYPTFDTTKPYKPTSGYLDEEYKVVVIICTPFALLGLGE